MRREWPLLLIVIVYLVVGTLYAVYTPAWQAPDEPAHYNYVRQLAAGHLPVIEPGDYDQAYQSLVVASKFDPRYSVEPFLYEDWQPPLYYLLGLPVFVLADGLLTPLRLLSVLLGAGIVVLAYLTAREVWPGESSAARSRALTATVFVAFLPQHVAIMSAVNNDSLAELLVAAILWLLLVQVRRNQGEQPPESLSALRLWGLIGLLLGLGFVAKVSVYIMAPLIALTHCRLYWGRWRVLTYGLLWLVGPALALGLLWWGRNVLVYQALDPLASAAHDAVVVGQPRTVEWLADLGVLETLARFLRTSFNSFWGQFGWMAAPMPGWVYAPLFLFSLLVLAGLLFPAVASAKQDTSGGDREVTPVRKTQVLILSGLFALSLLAYLGYNAIFVQHQGRYLFPALIPIGLGVSAGLAALARPVQRRFPWSVPLLPLLLGVALVGLDLLALFRFIVPYLGSS